MIAPDELRLARAKAIYSHMFPERDWHQETDAWLKGRYLDCARAIEPSDAALGVVSVPVELSEEMSAELRGMVVQDRSEAAEIWANILSSSPLAPEEPT